MSAIDLEDAIYKAWQTSDDLDLFIHHYGDHPKPMTEDEVVNTLLGLKMLHEMRMEQLFTKYKQEFQLDEYCTDEKKLSERERLTEVIAKVTEDMAKPKKKGEKK